MRWCSPTVGCSDMEKNSRTLLYYFQSIQISEMLWYNLRRIQCNFSIVIVIKKGKYYGVFPPYFSDPLKISNDIILLQIAAKYKTDITTLELVWNLMAHGDAREGK